MIGTRIKEAIKNKGLTQYKLAERVYVEPSTISHYINNKRGKSIDILVAICKELDVSADYILGLTDDMEVKR